MTLQKITNDVLPEVFELVPRVFDDSRGFFTETYNERVFKELGVNDTFVQDNHSRSCRRVLRGLHYQVNTPQAKLVRVVNGIVFDVAVDIRQHSTTFGRWYGVVLSDTAKNMLYIPRGFAHGFYTISETVDLLYKCSALYSPGDDRGIVWNDPDINVKWSFLNGEPSLSEKDAGLPRLRDAQDLL